MPGDRFWGPSLYYPAREYKRVQRKKDLFVKTPFGQWMVPYNML